MQYYSNSILYYTYKIFAFSYCPVFLIVGVIELYATELTVRTILSAAFLSGISISLFLLFYKLNKNFVQVAITNDYLYILNSSLKISWLEIESIRFKWYGLYRLKIHEQFYIFTPYDLGINIFGYKVFTDEFDDLINKKKKELGI